MIDAWIAYLFGFVLLVWAAGNTRPLVYYAATIGVLGVTYALFRWML